MRGFCRDEFLEFRRLEELLRKGRKVEGFRMDPNDLMALIDGRVSEEEREKLEGQLADSSEDFWHYLAIREREEVGGEVWRNGFLGRVVIAAAAIVFAVIGFFAGWRTQENFEVGQLVFMELGGGWITELGGEE